MNMAKSSQAQESDTTDDVHSSSQQTRVTFSITTLISELPGQLYVMAKTMRVGVASVFRHNLSMYAVLLDEEENALSVRDRKVFLDIVNTVALSHLCRVEGMPDRQSLSDHLTRASRHDLCEVLHKATTIRLLLIVDRARSMSAQPSSNGRV